jgi:hypothetical protein
MMMMMMMVMMMMADSPQITHKVCREDHVLANCAVAICRCNQRLLSQTLN